MWGSNSKTRCPAPRINRTMSFQWTMIKTLNFGRAGLSCRCHLRLTILTCPIIKIPVANVLLHDDVIKWKHFPRYWLFVRGIHRSHKGQWRGALIFSLICAWINGWVNNREAGNLRRHRAHFDVIVMVTWFPIAWQHSRQQFRSDEYALG